MVKLLHESSNIYVIFALVVYNIMNTALFTLYGRCISGSLVLEHILLSLIVLHVGNDLLICGIRFMYTLRLMYNKKTKENG